MAAEENKKFDAVLGGFLVNGLRVRGADLHCPESDTIAAYHERSLLPEEMNSWKEHIVGCARCQAILAELEATDAIPLEVSDKEVLMTAAMSAAVAGQAGNAATAEAPAKSRVTPISRGLRWQWLAPAGALAAGLLVWVAWRENRTQVSAPAEVKTARLEPPVLPPPVTRDDRQALSADEVARVSKDQSALSTAAVAKPAPEARGLKQFEKSDSRSKVALAKPTTGEGPKAFESSMPPSDKEAGARANTALDSVAAANRAQSQPAQDAKAGIAGVVSQTVEVQTPAANAQLQNQNQQAQQNLQAQQNQLNEQKTSGPNPSRHLEQAKKSKAESRADLLRAPAPSSAAAAPQPPAPPPVMAYSDGASLQIAAAISPHLIPTPNQRILWRAGHVGMIEFSSDAGASWSRQASNVSVDLTAGSAPSEKVCWIVGRAGTILLTADAGVHWAPIHSPLEEDLSGVHAADALHATIWNLGNTKVFETSDGGATWKPATSQ